MANGTAEISRGPEQDRSLKRGRGEVLRELCPAKMKRCGADEGEGCSCPVLRTVIHLLMVSLEMPAFKVTIFKGMRQR